MSGLHFNFPRAEHFNFESLLKHDLETQSAIEQLEQQARNKLPAPGRAPAPAPFSFPSTVQAHTSPLSLFPNKVARLPDACACECVFIKQTYRRTGPNFFSLQTSNHTRSSDDAHLVSNSSASISEGFDTSGSESGEDAEVILSTRPPALALRPPAPRLSPLLSTTDSHLGPPSAPLRLEAAAFVTALSRHSLQLRAALVILGYQDFWPSEDEYYRSFEATLAGMLALARRAGAQPRELTSDFLLTILWLLHAFDSQVGGWASDVASRFTVLLPLRQRDAAREALQRGMLDLQGPLLERCGWRVRIVASEVAPALAELRTCAGFQPWCAAAGLELSNLLKKRPPRVQSPVVAVEPVLSEFEAGGPKEAVLMAALAALRPPKGGTKVLSNAALGPSALLGGQSSALVPFLPVVPLPGLQAAVRGEDAAQGGRQPWRKRLRGVDSAAEAPSKQVQRTSIASRFHTALRGMFGGGGVVGGGGGGGGVGLLQGPASEEFEEYFESAGFAEE
jgi:hypothetical protein